MDKTDTEARKMYDDAIKVRQLILTYLFIYLYFLMPWLSRGALWPPSLFPTLFKTTFHPNEVF